MGYGFIILYKLTYGIPVPIAHLVFSSLFFLCKKW